MIGDWVKYCTMMEADRANKTGYLTKTFSVCYQGGTNHNRDTETCNLSLTDLLMNSDHKSKTIST